MSKAALPISLFFMACAANSLLSWLASTSPAGGAVAKFVYSLLIVGAIVGIAFDDGIRPITGLLPAAYYTVIAIALISALFGAMLVWMNL